MGGLEKESNYTFEKCLKLFMQTLQEIKENTSKPNSAAVLAPLAQAMLKTGGWSHTLSIFSCLSESH